LRISVRDISLRLVGESVDNVSGVYDSRPGIDVIRRCMFSLFLLLLVPLLPSAMAVLFPSPPSVDDEDDVSDFSSSDVFALSIIVRLYR
jgi:hypothetical protein